MAQIKPLSDELQKVAIDELGEVPARIGEDLQALKTWIDQQPHLKARTEDQFLIQFLRGCKYRLERAKEKLDLFYAMKTKYSELFSLTDVDGAKFRQLHNTGSCIALPIPLNGCGPRIIFTRFNFCAKEFSAHEAIQYCEALHEVALMNDPYACLYGLIYVTDYAQATTNHLLQVTPGNLLKMASFYEKTFPVRVKAICLINLPRNAQQLFKIVMPWLPEKLRQRVFISGKNMDGLTDYLPQKYLPREYGGENGSLDQLCLEYNKVWDTNREYFKQNAEYGTDERLRLGKPIDFNGDLGIGGTFRRLDID